MYRLFVAGKPVGLTSREIKLLSILFDRVGKITRKLTLYDAMYGHQASIHPSALNVTMCRLRRKLKDAESDLILRSVPGRGVVLEVLLRADAGVFDESGPQPLSTNPGHFGDF